LRRVRRGQHQEAGRDQKCKGEPEIAATQKQEKRRKNKFGGGKSSSCVGGLDDSAKVGCRSAGTLRARPTRTGSYGPVRAIIITGEQSGRGKAHRS